MNGIENQVSSEKTGDLRETEPANERPDILAKLRERIRIHNADREALLNEILLEAGIGDPKAFAAQSFAQSQLFMVELIPVIHRLYDYAPTNSRKTVLDVGPQACAGTQLLASIHSPQSFVKLKFDVSTLDIVDQFDLVRELLVPSSEFIKSDVFDIKDRSWDLVIASHVIEHVPNPGAFVRQLQKMARDYVLIACPWNENPIVTNTHINTIDKKFVRSMGGRDLNIYTNYSWGKEREVCIFWLPGLSK